MKYFTDDEIRAICRSSETNEAIAKVKGVTEGSIRRIRSRETYPHVSIDGEEPVRPGPRWYKHRPVAVGEGDGRYCYRSRCEKLLVRNEKETTAGFAGRKFCGRDCYKASQQEGDPVSSFASEYRDARHGFHGDPWPASASFEGHNLPLARGPVYRTAPPMAQSMTGNSSAMCASAPLAGV